MKIKFLISQILWIISSHAVACSCGGIPVDKIALGYKNFTAVEILKPSPREWIENFIIRGRKDNDLEAYRVKLIKNYVGDFKQKIIFSSPSKERGDCGIKIKSGDKVFIYGWSDGEKVVSTRCNTSHGVNDTEFLKAIDQSKSDLIKIKKMETKSWTSIGSENLFNSHVEFESYSGDGEQINFWGLTNQSKSNSISPDLQRYNSFKYEATISCLHKKYNMRSIYYFSEANAGGEIVDFKNYAKHNFYKWIDIERKSSFDIIMKKLCH